MFTMFHKLFMLLRWYWFLYRCRETFAYFEGSYGYRIKPILKLLMLTDPKAFSPLKVYFKQNPFMMHQNLDALSVYLHDDGVYAYFKLACEKLHGRMGYINDDEHLYCGWVLNRALRLALEDLHIRYVSWTPETIVAHYSHRIASEVFGPEQVGYGITVLQQCIFKTYGRNRSIQVKTGEPQ